MDFREGRPGLEHFGCAKRYMHLIRKIPRHHIETAIADADDQGERCIDLWHCTEPGCPKMFEDAVMRQDFLRQLWSHVKTEYPDYQLRPALVNDPYAVRLCWTRELFPKGN